jgi:predicted molibdopterin-dependent oxidoreductase YjgC
VTDSITVIVNGMPHRVSSDVTLAAALCNAGISAFRRDTTGHPRAPVCAMGTCQECRVTVNGLHNVRACLEPVRDGMTVDTAT